MNWLLARLREPSTYAGLAGLCMSGCFVTFTSWPYWRWLGIASGFLFVLSAIKAEQRGR